MTLVEMLSHALGGPLQALTVGLHLVETRLKDSADEVPRDWLMMRCEHLSSATDRLLLLSERLLDARARPDEAVPLRRERCEVGAILREVVARLGAAVRVEQSKPEEGDWDRLHLETLLANLLEEAAAMASRGPIDLVVGGDREAATLLVSWDRPVQTAGDIRDRLHRVRQTPRRVGGDVRLWIVSKLVDAHDGSIDADRAGRALRITLPRGPTPSLRPSPGA
jgi:K+-sensing histidine kinase KdpD